MLREPFQSIVQNVAIMPFRIYFRIYFRGAWSDLLPMSYGRICDLIERSFYHLLERQNFQTVHNRKSGMTLALFPRLYA